MHQCTENEIIVKWQRKAQVRDRDRNRKRPAGDLTGCGTDQGGHRSEEVESSGKEREREREWGCRALLGAQRDKEGGGKTSGKAQILAREDVSASSSSRLCEGGPRCYSYGSAHS